MKGLIFSIKRYSVHDGPGIRVTFFMKGCPLACIWCHNPEGLSPLPEKVIKVNKVGGTTFSNEEEVGKYYQIKELLEILEKERVFIDQSDGGVTFSGGEPMLQFDFLLEALKACKKAGFHTAIDTSGYSSAENYLAVIPYTDLFLFDLKHLDEKRHRELTGVSNRLILENCLLLSEKAKELVFRIPVIPGINDDQDHIKRMIQFIKEAVSHKSVTRISLLPYHRIGSSKYRKFNREWKMEGVEPPSREEMKHMKEIFNETGIRVKIGG